MDGVAGGRPWGAVDVALQADIEQFLYHEAELLDARAFEEWLALYADDAVYSVPQDAQSDPLHRVSLLYEDRRRLYERVLRLNSGFAYAQEPHSRTVHLIGNVRAGVDDEGLVHARSVLTVTEVRRGRQSVYSGEVDHRLRRVPDGFLIVGKEVRLVGSDLPLGNVTFLI